MGRGRGGYGSAMTNKPTDPSDGDPTEATTPAGQVEELIETAEASGASSDPADSEVGQQQLDTH